MLIHSNHSMLTTLNTIYFYFYFKKNLLGGGDLYDHLITPRISLWQWTSNPYELQKLWGKWLQTWFAIDNHLPLISLWEPRRSVCRVQSEHLTPAYLIFLVRSSKQPKHNIMSMYTSQRIIIWSNLLLIYIHLFAEERWTGCDKTKAKLSLSSATRFHHNPHHQSS